MCGCKGSVFLFKGVVVTLDFLKIFNKEWV